MRARIERGKARACLRRFSPTDGTSSSASMPNLASSALSPMPVPHTDTKTPHQPSRRCTPRPASDSPDSSSSCGVCSVPVQTHQKKRRVSATLSKRKKSPPGPRTGRKHDLPLHMDHVLHARHHELDAARDEVRVCFPFRAARVEEHAGGLCAGEDDEVGAVCVGLVVRLRRRRRRRRA